MNERQTDGAAFIARMAAGTTHEFRNVLAIVGESAGLIQDLLLARGSTAPAQDGVLRATQRIEKQVARGAELVSALNWLAHALDQESELMDLADQVKIAAVLCRHWIGQQERRVTVAPATGVKVCASRLRLCQALTAAIECAVGAAPAGSQVSAAAMLRDHHPALSFCWDGSATANAVATTPAWHELQQAAAAVGATVEAPAAATEFVVLFPRSPERA